jgi:hypothetical protein
MQQEEKKEITHTFPIQQFYRCGCRSHLEISTKGKCTWNTWNYKNSISKKQTKTSFLQLATNAVDISLF